MLSPYPCGAARTALLTAAALFSFAANSLLCRAALGSHSIDAATFATVRLLAGALTLALLSGGIPGVGSVPAAGNVRGAAALFAYAAAFSYAYLRLGAGTGALVLFGSVQVAMIGASLLQGVRPRAGEWVGLALAFGGLLALTRPGLLRPDLWGIGLMAVAGVAWAMYSLAGRGSARPLLTTAGNFARSLVPTAALSLVTLSHGHAAARGVVLAAASGALASGVGYSLWYAALPGLSATRAAIVQLAVPVLAASAGVALLHEALTPRLVGSAGAILGGVAIAVFARGRPSGTGR